MPSYVFFLYSLGLQVAVVAAEEDLPQIIVLTRGPVVVDVADGISFSHAQ